MYFSFCRVLVSDSVHLYGGLGRFFLLLCFWIEAKLAVAASPSRLCFCRFLLLKRNLSAAGQLPHPKLRSAQTQDPLRLRLGVLPDPLGASLPAASLWQFSCLLTHPPLPSLKPLRLSLSAEQAAETSRVMSVTRAHPSDMCLSHSWTVSGTRHRTPPQRKSFLTPLSHTDGADIRLRTQGH